MIASDVMAEDPKWVEENETVGEAVRVLDEGAVRHVPVLRDGVVVGIVSDRDLRSALPPPDALRKTPMALLAWLDVPLSDVMTQPVTTVEPDRDLGDVVDRMLEERIGAVVVVDPDSDKLVGIISYVDILHAVRDLVRW